MRTVILRIFFMKTKSVKNFFQTTESRAPGGLQRLQNVNDDDDDDGFSLLRVS